MPARRTVAPAICRSEGNAQQAPAHECMDITVRHFRLDKPKARLPHELYGVRFVSIIGGIDSVDMELWS